MYKLLLIRKYLLKRRIAWVALVAVMLCTAMVLVVISVMGGWLAMFKTSFRGMTSDIVVQGQSEVGFPYYEEMLVRIRALPEVAAAEPVIHTFGLINIGNRIRQGVEVTGFDLGKIGSVGEFPKSLSRQYEKEKRATASFDLLPDMPYKDLAGPRAKDDVTKRPGLIVSDALVGIKKGEPPPEAMYELPTTLTLLPVLPGEAVKAQDAVTPAFWIVDDARSRIWQMDFNRVYVPFDELQKDLRMTAFDGDPARTSDIQIKVKDGFDLNLVRAKVEKIVDDARQDHAISDEFPLRVATWEQIQGNFIAAVEHEVVLTTALFGIISMVAVLLVFCIFYMIVLEKTKDIGVIKSVGATAGGILQLFLGYGLAIGVVGSGLGLTAAYLIVHNINELHGWLSTQMGVTIWDPETYQFDKIPNTMNPATVVWIVAVAILSALLGALLPAIRAARMNPVEALRYE
jgi:lipoprotein-releasing system permease protein